MRKHLVNMAGIMLGLSLVVFGVLFGLWQLDIIVSGPVWHMNPDGSGWAWHNGAYASAYFQCFLWRTTIGQAYDTLFLVIFISAIAGFVIAFISLWYWNE